MPPIETDMETRYWILTGVCILLFGVVTWFFTNLIKEVKEQLKSNEESLNAYKAEVSKEIVKLTNEINERKNNQVSLAKDIEIVKVHLEYQKESNKRIEEMLSSKLFELHNKNHGN